MSTKYPSLRVEGGFLAAEIVDDIAEGKAAGQKPRDSAPLRVSCRTKLICSRTDRRV